MLRIYQIGNFKVDLVASSNQSVTHALPTNFRRPADILTGVSGDVVYARPGRPLVKTGKWKVEGALLCEAAHTCASVDQQFNQLIANGGDVVPIIGVVPPECCPCTMCKGTGCSSCGASEAMWLLSYGMVTGYKSDYKQDFAQSFGIGELNVSMSLEGAVYWEPLNDVEWKFWGRGLPTYPSLTSTIAKNVHPLQVNWNGKLESGFQKIINDGTIMYDPANWVLGYSPVFRRRQRAVLTSSDYTTPTITITSATAHSHIVDLPYSNWPATPKSMYYFSNLPTSGEITITVETLTINGFTITSVATLDLAVLDANSVLGGITVTDIMVTGAAGEGAGVYLRGGLLQDIYVPWVKEGGYPGETLVGRNTVTVEVTNTDAEIEFAYLHVFRRY